jgi:uncharacterized protein (TIGR02996 family)
VTVSDLDGFVAALNDAPADLALYGVFADWLEESGEVRVGGVTYGPDFVYALRWCRGRKLYPLLTGERVVWRWRWLRPGTGGGPTVRRQRQGSPHALLPATVFDAVDLRAAVTWAHVCRDWQHCVGLLARSLRRLRDLASYPA